MAQHDYDISNASFPSTRSDINSALAAIKSMNSGTSSPSSTAAGMLWLDTTTSNEYVKIRNLADGAWITLFKMNAGPLARQDGSANYGVDSGSNDTYVATLDPAITAYTDGAVYVLHANTENTGAATANFNAVGAKTIKKGKDQDLETGDIKAGQKLMLCYDSNDDVFELLNPGNRYDFAPGQMNNAPPTWQSVTTVRIPSGFRCSDQDNGWPMIFTSNQDAVITASGASGLDTGSEAADTWYYLWAIGDSTGGNSPKAMLSTSNTSPTMPSGYDIKCLIPVPWRNDSGSDILNQVVISGFPANPHVIYEEDCSGTAGTLNVYASSTVTSWTATDISDLVPPISTAAYMNILMVYTSASGTHSVRATGTTHSGKRLCSVASGYTAENTSVMINTDTSQSYDRIHSSSGTYTAANVFGYCVNNLP